MVYNFNTVRHFILFTLFIILSNLTYSQEKFLELLPMKDGKVNYNDVVLVDSCSKDRLYLKAKHWFIDSYRSAKDVIQLDDKENGELIGKGFFETYWQILFYAGQQINVWYTVKIQMKENKFRYEITDFRIKYYSAPTSKYDSGSDVDLPLEEWNKQRPENLRKVCKKIDIEIQNTISTLKSTMKSQMKNEDW